VESGYCYVMTAPESRSSVARQAAADVEQVIRGKRWLQRVIELADSAAVDLAHRERRYRRDERHAS
jgi:hypothetical protein